MKLFLYSLLVFVFSLGIQLLAKNRAANKYEDLMHEYQVEIDMDTVYVYDNGRYVDCYIIGETLNAFDEIMALDNR